MRILRRRLRHGVADHNRPGKRPPSHRQIDWDKRIIRPTSAACAPKARRPLTFSPHPAALDSAYLRADRGQPLETVDMDTAITRCAKRLRAIIDKARSGRRGFVRFGADVARGPVSGQQADQGVHRHQPDRVELATVHGQRQFRIQAVPGRRRTSGFLPGLRKGRRLLRHRRQYGRLPPDSVPADDGAGQGRRQTDRRRSAPHRDRGQGRPVPADRPRHGSRAAQRTAAPDRRERAHRHRLHRRVHRGLGGDAEFPRAVHAGQSQRNHRHPSRRHPHRGALDRRSRKLDELLDDGSQPEHPRHLEHQRDLQSAPGHRRDLQTRQRPFLAHRTAQRDGRPRNGLHGTGFAGSAVGDRRRRPRVRGGPVGHSPRIAAHRCQRRRHRHVLPDGRRPDQGVLDHLHQSRCHAWPIGRQCWPVWKRPNW